MTGACIHACLPWLEAMGGTGWLPHMCAGNAQALRSTAASSTTKQSFSPPCSPVASLAGPPPQILLPAWLLALHMPASTRDRLDQGSCSRCHVDHGLLNADVPVLSVVLACQLSCSISWL
jgi:hypothetical protein